MFTGAINNLCRTSVPTGNICGIAEEEQALKEDIKPGRRTGKYLPLVLGARRSEVDAVIDDQQKTAQHRQYIPLTNRKSSEVKRNVYFNN